MAVKHDGKVLPFNIQITFEIAGKESIGKRNGINSFQRRGDRDDN